MGRALLVRGERLIAVVVTVILGTACLAAISLHAAGGCARYGWCVRLGG